MIRPRILVILLLMVLNTELVMLLLWFVLVCLVCISYLWFWSVGGYV